MLRYQHCTAILLVSIVLGTACAPTPPDIARTQRLTQVALARQSAQPGAPPLVLPLDARCRGLRGVTAVVPEGLQFTGGAPGAGFFIDVDFDASFYNRLEVEMQVDQGKDCRFSWSSDIEPVRGDMWIAGSAPIVEEQIFSGATFRAYVLELGPQFAWQGRIHRVHFVPSMDRSRAVIRSMRLYHSPVTQPKRVEFAGDWKEALFGSQPPWTFRVPEDGVFETFLGMHPRAWEGTFKGAVRFLVTLDSGREKGKVLINKKFTPGLEEQHRSWVRLRRDLSAYAGEEITLSLSIDPLEVSLGDYAFWGNPMVFSDAQNDADIPVILISCDTLRADHLSCYGHTRETSPRLDAWAAEEAVLFENAITPVTWTLPSHMTMMTGLYPKNHRTTLTSNLPLELTTLPEVLREADYVTGGFTGISFWFLPSWGYKNFDQYRLPESGFGFRHIYPTSDLVENWLGSLSTSRFFLFFHNFDCHWKNSAEGYEDPYDPGDVEFRLFSRESYQKGMFSRGTFGDRIGTEILDAYNGGLVSLSEEHHKALNLLYDDAIRMVDQSLGDFFDLLRQQDRYDNALIIVTADHGEDLNDHGTYGHTSVYEVDCHVPLIVKFPGGEFAGTRFAPQVETTDIFATILDVLGLPEEPDRDGRSLRKVLMGEAPPRTYTHTVREENYSTRTNEEKLIYRRSEAEDPYALFDLEIDPAEKRDIFAENAEKSQTLRGDLHAFFPIPTEGWRISMVPGETASSVRVLVDADDPFTLFWTTPKREINVMTYDAGDPPLVVENTPVNRLANVVIQTASTAAKVRIEIIGAAPIEVLRGSEAPMLTLRYAATLDPEVDVLPKPALPQNPPHSVIALWYERPGLEQETAPTPDAETREILQGIGYL